MRSVAVPAPMRPALLLVAAALCGLAGCTQNLNVEAVAPSISQGVADQVGLKLAKVTCPSEPRPLKANDTFDCMGEVEGGGRLTIAVTQTDDTGNITWKVARTDGLLDLDEGGGLDHHRPQDPGESRRHGRLRRQVEGRR